MNSLILFSIFSVTLLLFGSSVESRKDKIKLKDIQVLTLKPNEWTTGRRSKAVPQLQCVGGYCDAIKGETVQCYNRGSDGVDIQWECKAIIDSSYKLGSLDVICEGYDYADDDYVLVGSCGLEYRIDALSNKPNNQYTNTPLRSKPSEGFSFFFIISIIFIVFIIYYTCLRPNRLSTERDQRRTPSAPPPPPGFRSDFFGSSEGCNSSSGSTGYTDNREPGNANNSSGFFSGILTGGTLGYLFGSSNRTNYRNQSSYFGQRASPPPYFSEPYTRSNPSTTSDSSKTTTSGFGGTKRR